MSLFCEFDVNLFRPACGLYMVLVCVLGTGCMFFWTGCGFGVVLAGGFEWLLVVCPALIPREAGVAAPVHRAALRRPAGVLAAAQGAAEGVEDAQRPSEGGPLDCLYQNIRVADAVSPKPQDPYRRVHCIVPNSL